MNKLILILLIAGGYYYYTTLPVTYDIADVNNNPVPTSEYIKHFEALAHDSCKINAKDYNIELNKCPSYINKKLAKCQSKLPSSLPEVVDNRELGKNIINNYFQCIAPAPHCNGFEILDDWDFQKYCRKA
jgi:hypothetical protein